ncbi:MAG: pilus assembly protein [Chloroflexota bacterium]|nr:pilus assembly protein [Chloroflexota bacterium]
MKTRRRFLKAESGSAAAELALLAPLLALLLGAVIEVGSIVQTAQVVRNAAREGARYAAVGDPAAATDAINYLQSVFGTRTDVTLPPVGAVSIVTSSIGTTDAVSVSVPVVLKVGMPVIQNLLGTNVTLTGSATMRIQ